MKWVVRVRHLLHKVHTLQKYLPSTRQAIPLTYTWRSSTFWVPGNIERLSRGKAECYKVAFPCGSGAVVHYQKLRPRVVPFVGRELPAAAFRNPAKSVLSESDNTLAAVPKMDLEDFPKSFRMSQDGQKKFIGVVIDVGVKEEDGKGSGKAKTDSKSAYKTSASGKIASGIGVLHVFESSIITQSGKLLRRRSCLFNLGFSPKGHAQALDVELGGFLDEAKCLYWAQFARGVCAKLRLMEQSQANQERMSTCAQYRDQKLAEFVDSGAKNGKGAADKRKAEFGDSGVKKAKSA